VHGQQCVGGSGAGSDEYADRHDGSAYSHEYSHSDCGSAYGHRYGDRHICSTHGHHYAHRNVRSAHSHEHTYRHGCVCSDCGATNLAKMEALLGAGGLGDDGMGRPIASCDLKSSSDGSATASSSR
jgi:hypothetical protein